MATWSRAGVNLMLVVSLCGNAWLGDRLLGLERTLSSLTARRALEVGFKVPDLTVQSVRGIPFVVRYSDVAIPTIIYALSTTCRWCDLNRNSVVALANALVGRGRFIGLAIDSPDRVRESVASQALPFDVYSGLSDTLGRRLHLRSTPTTIVVSPTGVVEAVWEGAYGGDTKRAIEEHFGVILPPFDPTAATSTTPAGARGVDSGQRR